MKKVVALLTAVCLSITPITVFADGFSLRNDIHFGDSFEEVKEKETIELNDARTYAEMYADEDEDYEVSPEKANITISLSKFGTIANIEDSRVEYTFDNDSLIKMEYTLGSYDGYDSSDSSKLTTLLTDNFKMVVSTLTDKYGDPIYLEEGKEFKFHTSLWDMYLTMEEFLSYGLGGDTIGFKEWFVEADDGSHVVIDASCFYNESLYDGSLRGNFQVAYELVPEDEWDDAVNSAIEKQNNLDNDL